MTPKLEEIREINTTNSQETNGAPQQILFNEGTATIIYSQIVQSWKLIHNNNKNSTILLSQETNADTYQLLNHRREFLGI